MKKLPLGIQTFSDILETGYYVDKTQYIYKLVQTGKYFFLARPRRFGKSSFLNTLSTTFSGQKERFNGLFLEKQWDWSKIHPILHLSFAGGVIRDLDGLRDHIQDKFLAFEKQLGIKLSSVSIQGKFSELILNLYNRKKQRVVVLIDEYDKPILDVINKDEVAIEIRDELKNLYSVLKDSDPYLEFVFITGVSKFSKVNLFSGLNNLMDISLNPDFGSVCGYTQEEVVNVFSDRLDGVPLDVLREWYNGYNFLGEKVYNPYDVLLYLQNKNFQNYWFQTGTPTFLIKLLENKKYNIPDLEKVQLSENAMDSFDIGSIELETLLFQTGYLTIQDRYQVGQKFGYHLRYPNLEVKKSLTDFILEYLTSSNATKEKTQYELMLCLERKEIGKLKDLFHRFFASIPYNWYTKNDLADYEGYYSSIFYCYFTALGLEVLPEDTTNHGRIDMAVMYKNTCYILEFKVIEFCEKGNALNQIKKMKYYEKYKGYESKHIDSGKVEEIYLIGVEFSKMDRNITNFEWEKV